MNATDPRYPRFHRPTWYADQLAESCAGPPLSGAHRCGTLVVGGGLAGLSTALGLADRNAGSVMVLERGQVGEGASGRNGGFVFAGFSLDNLALADQVGDDVARRLHGWSRDAVRLVRARCRDWGVACEDAGVVLADWFEDDAALARWREMQCQRLGFELDWIDAADLAARWVASPRYGAGLHEPGSFHFNPLAYVRAMHQRLGQAGVRVAERSAAVALDRDSGGWRVRTHSAEIRADRVVLASGGYEQRLRRSLLACVQPIATYIAVTEPLGATLAELIPGRVAVYDTRFAFDYYRPLPDTRLLWGGRISIADRSPDAIRGLLARDLARVFPALAGVRFEHAWGGWMSYARHQMPVLAEPEPGLWTALAFGGHGMAITALAGEVVAEAITGDRGRLAEFARWGPVWAGGRLGRAAVQGVYWYKQLRDRLR